jgi:small subunit ribosomal protein S6
MVRDYELMYIVRPDLDEESLKVTTDSVEGLIRGLGGEIEKTTMWGKRRLAYEVKHLRDGHYVISYIRLDGERVAQVERALRIHDTVFRHLLVVRESAADLETGEAATSDGETGNRAQGVPAGGVDQDPTDVETADEDEEE